MNADDYERAIYFTDPAKHDLEALKARGFDRENFLRMKGTLIQVARLRNVLSHPFVCELRMCRRGDPTWHRLKLPHLKHCGRAGMRVAFEADRKTLVIWAVLARDSRTYQVIETRLRNAAKGKARR